MNLNKNTYQNFDFDDFITDEAFQNWAINAEEDSFWLNFINNHPAKAEMIDLARNFILNIRFVEHIPADEVISRSFSAHVEQLEKYRQAAEADTAPVKKRFSALQIAAIWAFLILSSGLGWYVYDYNGEQSYHTQFGQTRTIHLPDNSVVMLQANSTIHYPKHWSKNRARQVWLNGEAYFAVNHLNKRPADIMPSERFIVNTKALNVEVLGTVFNVKERRGITSVVLQSGRVKVALNRAGQASQGKSTWYLNPGEAVSYQEQGKAAPAVFKVNAGVKTAWTKGLIIFDGLTSKDVLEYLADNYGYKIIVKDTSIYQYQLSGKLKLESERDLIFTLENVLKLNVQKTDSTLTIQKRTPN